MLCGWGYVDILILGLRGRGVWSPRSWGASDFAQEAGVEVVGRDNLRGRHSVREARGHASGMMTVVNRPMFVCTNKQPPAINHYADSADTSGKHSRQHQEATL